nr:MAG TPA: repressor protein CI [Crassvirales sp.]
MRTKIDVRRAIKERFGTISAFCEQTGLRTQNIIQNIIKGNPSIKKLEELCEKMGCDVTDLFYPIDEAGDGNNVNKSEAAVNDTTQTTMQPQSESTMGAASVPLMQANPVFCPHCGKQVRIGVVLLPEA